MKKVEDDTSRGSFRLKFGTHIEWKGALSNDTKIIQTGFIAIKVIPKIEHEAQIVTTGLTLNPMSNWNYF